MTLADKLKPHVDAIKASAKSGNPRAQEIIQLYRMHCDCPSDPGAPALCEAAFEGWLKEARDDE